jgi:cold shock CspA family protein
MAPISARMQSRYDQAVQCGIDFFDGNLTPDEVALGHLSELKGMFNRCLRQDQWDWFSVFTDLGEPKHEDLKVLGHRIGQLRQAIKAGEQTEVERSKRLLAAANILTYLLTWQNGAEHACGGWIYILSARDQPEILKIGMTTTSVAKRVRQINSATGLLIPFSARKVFRVTDPTVAEAELFRVLAPYRIRPDREFFRLPFGTAVSTIEEHLETSRLRQRKRGRIVWFDVNKQYGFIDDGSSDDLFLHLSQVEKSDAHRLKPGQEVEFDLGHRPQGRCALQVRLADQALGKNSEGGPFSGGHD